jgi:type IV secretory pathway VirB6-like protein
MNKLKNFIQAVFIFVFLTINFHLLFLKNSHSAVDRVRNVTGKNCELDEDESNCDTDATCSATMSIDQIEPCYTSNYNDTNQTCEVGDVSFNPFGNDIHWDLANDHCISYVITTAVGLAGAFLGCDVLCPSPVPINTQLTEITKNLKQTGKYGGQGMVAGKEVIKESAEEASKSILKVFKEQYQIVKSAISKNAKTAASFAGSAGSNAGNMVSTLGVIDPLNIIKIGIYSARCANILNPVDGSSCCTAAATCSIAYSTAIGILGGIFETSKRAFEDMRICGESSKIWKKVKYDNKTHDRWTQVNHDYFACLKYMFTGVTSINKDPSNITKPTNCDLNISNRRLCELFNQAPLWLNTQKCQHLPSYNSVSKRRETKDNRFYREFLYKGIEYEDNGDGACDNPKSSGWGDELGYKDVKQKYYFNGPNREPNFACQRFLAKGNTNEDGRKAFECCKKRAKDTICLENKSGNGNYKFCSANGSQCWIGSRPYNPVVRYKIFKSSEDPNYLCAQSYSVCPFDYPIGGGTEIAEIDSKTGIISNFCQYRRHCIKLPPTYEINQPEIGGSFFSESCINKKGDTQFYTNLASINSPIPLKSRNFSAPIVQCLKESLENNFFQVYGRDLCENSSDIIENNKCKNLVTGVLSPILHEKGSKIGDNLLAKIQNYFGYFIKLALVFAVMMFGYNILLASPEMFINKKTLLLFIIKIGLVSFFTLDKNWHGMFMNSLLKISTELSEITFMPQQNYNDGCTFPKYDYTLLNQYRNNIIGFTEFKAKNTESQKQNKISYSYETSYLRIWDTLDCKLARALGYGPDVNSENFTKMIFAGFISGPLGITLLFASFAYGFMLISIILRSIHIAIMSIVGVILLLFISPITITCVLFERTKGIFENWYKQMFGFILQPMILFAYLGLLLTIFDNIFIGDARINAPSSPNSLYESLPTIDCSDYGPNNSIKPSNTSIYCIFGFQTFKKYTGLEIFNIALPVLTNLTKEKISTIIRAAIILFIFYQFLDKITFVARKLVGGVELKPDDMPDIKSKLQKFTKGVQTRALNTARRFGTEHSKKLVGSASQKIAGAFGGSKDAPTTEKNSQADSVSFDSGRGSSGGGDSGGGGSTSS